MIDGFVDVRLSHPAAADVAGALAFLATRAVPGVEAVLAGTTGEPYGLMRAVAAPSGPAVVELVTEHGGVRARLRLSEARDRTATVAHCRRLLDLDTDPVAVDAALAADAVLAPIVAAAPGVRVPGAVDGTELAVRAVLGQQVSVAAARGLAGRLVAAYGTPLEDPIAAVTHTFPTAAALAAVDPAEFPMPRSRGRTLHELATRLADGRIDLELGTDGDEAERSLLEVPGVGPWTAGYIRMRALGDPDVFLPTDLAVRRGLAAVGLPTDARAAVSQASRWRPWRSYALMHLWRQA